MDFKGNKMSDLKKIEFEGVFFINADSEIDQINKFKDNKFANVFKTKEIAKEACELTAINNKLLNRAREIDPDWVADWSNKSQKKYNILFAYDFKAFWVDCTETFMCPGTVYMSEKTAMQIHDELDKGLFKLGCEE
jgi:hypothetical protein